MTLYLKLFSFLLVSSGVYRLYDHFSIIGKVTSAGEVINTNVMLGVFGIVVGLGLMLRFSWARLAAMGISLAGAVVPVVAGIYLAFNFRQYMMAFAYIALLLQSFPVFLQNIFGYVLLGLVAGLFGSLIFLLGFLQLRSEYAKEYYEDKPWFGRDFQIGNFDLRPVLFSGLLVFIFQLDKMLPEKFKRTLQSKEFVESTKVLKQELEKDPAYVKQQQEIAEQKQRALDDSQSAVHMQFSPDDTKLLVVTRDKKLHVVDLNQYQEKGFEFGDFHRDRINHIASDGSYYFLPDKNVFVQTSNQLEIPLPGSRVMVLGFASPTENVLIYKGAEKLLALINIKNNQTLWSIPWEGKNQPFLNGVFWSADRKIVLLAPSEEFFLLDVNSGKFQAADFKFRYPEFTSSNREAAQFMVSGPVGFNQNDYKTYMIDTKTGVWSEVQSKERIIGFDPISQVFTASWAAEVKLLKMASPEVPAKTFTVTYGEKFLKASGQPWALVLKSNATQVEFLNLETNAKVKLGRIFSSERPIDDRVSQLAMTASGSLWAISNRNKFEIFWSSEMDKPQPRSWQFEIEIQANEKNR